MILEVSIMKLEATGMIRYIYGRYQKILQYVVRFRNILEFWIRAWRLLTWRGHLSLGVKGAVPYPHGKGWRIFAELRLPP
jgi:hypothetical protein